MEVPVPAGPRWRGWISRPTVTAWVEAHRRPVIAGAFALAVLLGVGIGLVTAPSAPPPADEPPPAAAPALSPPLPSLPWGSARTPGKAENMSVQGEPQLRSALLWAAADAALASAGEQTLSQRFVAGGASAARGGPDGSFTTQALVIPEGSLYYGAIQGVDADSDQFWAVAPVQSSSTTVAVPTLHVWKREGSGPWQVVRTGPGACAALPQDLIGVWTVRPPACESTS